MAAAVSSSSSLDNLKSIIDSIELNIQYNLNDVPILIYVGIGTIAGMVRRDGEIPILDDENYHQFPPALQKLYLQIPNLHIFCIYIDPFLENIPFITQDVRMKEKMGWADWKYHHGFCYDNTRITIYPFRQSIIVNSTKEYRFKIPNFLNITNEIKRLHKISIENNITYLYHDFSGNDNIKYIEKYFINAMGESDESDKSDESVDGSVNGSIKNHLNHIIYGIGNGSITGCYYDFRKPEAHFAYVLEKTAKRPMISVFNINHVVDSYNNQKKYGIYNDFIPFLNEVIESYGGDSIEIITSIMCNHIDMFISQFRDYILYALRYIKDAQDKILKGDVYEFDINTYGFNNIFDRELVLQIRSIFDSHNIDMFHQIVNFIADKYQFEFSILGRKNKLSNREFLWQIVSNPDKYNWYTQFQMLYN